MQVLLEAGPIGWGASGRNGGQMHVGMRQDQAWLESHVGRDDAANLWRIAIDARDHLDALVADHGIECDLRTAYLHADHKLRYVPDTHANVDLLNGREIGSPASGSRASRFASPIIRPK